MSPANHFDRNSPIWSRMVWPFRVALFQLAILTGLVGCGESRHEQMPVPVNIRVLVPEKISVARSFSGSVEPLQSTTLAFKLGGTVQSLYRAPGQDRDVQVGDTLPKGAVIAELDEGDLRRAKASAEARVAQLEARVATAKDNADIAARNFRRFVSSAGSVSQAARDDADARHVAAAGELATAAQALAEARVQLDQAKDNYANRQLLVPFDNATVAEKHIEPGERKAAHEPAFRLIDISTVHITFGVPDSMIGRPAIEPSGVERVFLGQVLPVTADAFEGRAVIGTVTKIAPQADAKTRTFLTELTVQNEEYGAGQPLLRPGMVVSVRVGAETDHSVMLLPLSSIHQGRSADDLTVYEAVVDGGRDIVKAKRVKLGGVYNNEVEVLPTGSEVGAGSKIVISTAERLTDGVSVRILPEPGSSTHSAGEGL